jgi:hypothetical protein
MRALPAAGRLAIALLFTCAALASLGAATAGATTVSATHFGNPGSISVIGTPTADTITISLAAGMYEVTDPAGVTADTGSSEAICAQATPNEVDCTAAGLGFLSVDSDAGDDVVTVGADTAFTQGQVDLGDGNDIFHGGPEDDSGSSGDGDDLDDLGGGNDGNGNCFSAGAGNDTILGGDGNDGACLRGDEGDDTIDGGPGDDALSGGLGNDILRAGSGDDALDPPFICDIGCPVLPDLGNDTLEGDDGNDTLYATNGADSADGGAGDDKIYGVLYGEEVAADGTYEDGAIDTITCGDGNDEAAPGAGDELQIDCETLLARIPCGFGTCEGVASVTAPPPPAQSKRLGSRARHHHHRPPQPLVLGTADFAVSSNPHAPPVAIKLSPARVAKALKQRAAVTAKKTVTQRVGSAAPTKTRTKFALQR